jgi:hypothetical protein
MKSVIVLTPLTFPASASRQVAWNGDRAQDDALQPAYRGGIELLRIHSAFQSST